MKLKPGFPYVTLAALKDEGFIPQKFRIFTLADWILWCAGEKDGRINKTLAAATGFYDVNKEEWSYRLLNFLGFENSQIVLPKVSKIDAPIGHIKYLDQEIKVFGGVGDLQSAIYGATEDIEDTYCLNIGTGSQIICNYSEEFSNFEIRPGFFESNRYTVFSHIPSGRVLSSFANLIDEICLLSGGRRLFWEKFCRLRPSMILDSTLKIDMNVFSNTEEFFKGGSIENIREDNLNYTNLLSSLALSWLIQYVKIVHHLENKKSHNAFIVFGGLSRRLDFVPEVLQILLKKDVKVFHPKTGEETLDGLLKLSYLETIY